MPYAPKLGGGLRAVFFLLAFVLIAGLAGIRGYDPAPVSQSREAYFDYLQRLSPRGPSPVAVRIVDIDEASLSLEGQWPWPRHRLADLVDVLAEMGAAVIAFDVLFPEPDRLSAAQVLQDPRVGRILGQPPDQGALAALDNDLRFAAAIAGFPVVLGVADAGQENGQTVPGRAGFVDIGASRPSDALPKMRGVTSIIPPLLNASQGIGSINVSPFDDEGRVREVPLAWKTENGTLPSLALESLRLAFGESTVLLLGTDLSEAAVRAVRVGDFEIPTNAQGSLRVRYRRDDPSTYVSAADVLNPDYFDDLLALIEGHIVLVGTSAAGLLDIRATPLGETVPGVSIQAQIIEQVILEDFLIRNDVLSGVEILTFVGIGALLTALLAASGPIVAVAAGAASAVAVLGASWVAFDQFGVLLDATFPTLAALFTFTVLASFQFVVSDREKRLIRRSFTKYVSPRVLGEIEKQGHALELGGHIRPVTVMFSDIRDFTPLSETLTPQDLVALLNTCFSKMTTHILATQGTIDKFIGDAVMAFWNAPLEMVGHERMACLATLAMRRDLAEFNATRESEGLLPVKTVIGLATGPACVGNMGSEDRFNYSVVGDTVNVAARIESSCRHVEFDILVSEEVAKAAPGFAFLDAGRLELKGVSTRMPVQIILGDEEFAESQEFRELRDAYSSLLSALRDPAKDMAAAKEVCRSITELFPDELRRPLQAYLDRLSARHADFDHLVEESVRFV